MGIKRDGLTDGWTYKESKQIKKLHFLTYRQTDRHVNVWTDQQPDTQTDKQTDRQMDG